MRAAWLLAAIGFGIMSASLIYGFSFGDFWAEGRILLTIPWGRVTMFDIYTGFALFSGWVAFRERSALRAAAWTVGFLLLGNILTSLYVLLALRAARGNWPRFWMGARVTEAN